VVDRSVKVGRLFGIEIAISPTWLIIVGLVSVSLATSYYPDAAANLSGLTYWIMGVLSALLLFACVLIHELAHSIVARVVGLPVNGITLFLFGGVSDIQEEPHSPRDEFLVTVVGPLMSVLLGFLFLALYAVTPGNDEVISAMLGYLAVVNLLLALFNLIPGYPLDGGRILHSVIWKLSRNQSRATQIAAGVGVVFAWLFIVGGLLLGFLTVDFLDGLWLTLTGWFLLIAASSQGRSSRSQAVGA